MTYRDGSTAHVVSDGSWAMTDGPIMDSVRTGEDYDARLDPAAHWTQPGFDASAWTRAPEQPSPARNVRSVAMEPIRNIATLSPVATSSPAPGVTVYDFGRTTAGWALLTTEGNAGTTITLAYGETLNADGTVARLFHIDSYTLSGRGRETWEPSFTRHGFRFIEVMFAPAQPAVFEIQARVNHTDVRPTGEFRSASDIVNRLQANQRAIDPGQHVGVPHRYAVARPVGLDGRRVVVPRLRGFQFRCAAALRPMASNLSRFPGRGRHPTAIAPAPAIDAFNAANDPSWSGTIVLDAWALYQHYGDTRVLADNYDAMVRWMDLMTTTVGGTGNIYRGFSFGDWASPGSEANGSPFLNPPEGAALTATADLYQEARTLARIADVLERPADGAKYDAFADTIKAAFNATFFDAAGDVYRTDVDASYRQTSNLMPLAYGLVPADHADGVYANLVADIRSRGNHLNTGAIGTKQLLPVLTEHGDIDLAYSIASQTTYPSWGYWLEQGATSSWETWSHTGLLQSENHAFLGTFDDWLYRSLAGIRATAPGYATVQIKPAAPNGLADASASISTPRGEVTSAWRRTEEEFELTVAIPGNTSAEIHVPAGPDEDVAVKGTGEAHLLRRDERYAVFASGAGNLIFTVRRQP